MLRSTGPGAPDRRAATMARSARTRGRSQSRGKTADRPVDMAEHLRRIGQFETGSGFPHGWINIVAVMVLVLLVRPVARLLKAAARR